jgi:hypothetical protein
MIGVRIPAAAGNFSLRHRVQTDSEAHAASYPMGNGGLPMGVKRLGCEDDDSPPSSAGGQRIRGSIPPHPQYVFMAWCLVKHRETLPVLYLIYETDHRCSNPPLQLHFAPPTLG